MIASDATVPGVTVLALQGGGAHGAFAWGVLDRLLESGTGFAAISGVSSGALLGVMLAQGWARDAAAGARREMRRLWHSVAAAHAFSPWRNSPLERWLWGWDPSNSLAWQGMEAAMRLFSPAQLNPFGHNPLRPMIADLLDRTALTAPAAPRISIAATDVATGEAVLFDNATIDVDALLASCCLPMVFPAVEIGGRAFWDGAYSGNPPLAPLLQPLPARLVLIRGQPRRRPGVPAAPAEILNRLNEIACQGVLDAELARLPHGIALDDYAADEALLALPIASKLSGEAELFATLFEAGREAASRGPDRRLTGASPPRLSAAD
ncbi:MAG TPA: patatin-like phospholipase family protein [Acetobacteraceae bacterium]|nr:patatin-like phospholipase family protein [Acetobacteraceae bacterium]